MANNLKKFQTEAEYTAATLNYPSVAWVTDTDTVHFDKSAPAPSFEGKYRLTLSDSSTVSAECDGTSEITSGEVASQYSGTVVSAEIGDCVTSIGDSTFNGCRSLTSVTFGNSVTSIGGYALFSCRSLTSITIPNSVTSIGNYTFINCSGLTSITVNATTPPTLGSSAFDSSTCPIYVPEESVETYKATSGWSTYASRIQAIA